MNLNYILLRSITVIILVMFFASCQKQSSTNITDATIRKVDSLLSIMTLDEKLGQINQFYAADLDSISQDIQSGRVGSILNGRTEFYTPQQRNRAQRVAVEQTRLGIPIIFAHDVIHGFNTIFPLSLAQSCTWSPDMVEAGSAIAAREASASGVDWAFAPMVDVSRDPRWGRIAECYGEDPYLNGVLGAAVVSGFQGDDASANDKMLACMKHYVGYGMAEGGRDYQHTEISERSLRQTYLPPFKAGLDAGALTVMSAFNDISGVPSTANKFTLDQVLREEWGFKGAVVSDWDAVIQLVGHGVASDSASAAWLALSAGVDMDMKCGSYFTLKEKIESGELPIAIVDRAVKRVLYIKYKAGLFENPYTDTTLTVSKEEIAQHRKVARTVAGQTMVLLKNNNVLPLDTLKSYNVAVVGDFANERQLMGWWSSLGKLSDVVTPFDGLLKKAGKIHITKEVTPQTDFIIACVGEAYDQFGENNSVTDVRLDQKHRDLLQSLRKFNKPLVTVVFNGRPLALEEELMLSDAMLLAWHPGTEAGNALADVLFGVVNPSAKLTTSFPKSLGQIPMYYNHKNSGRPESDNYKGKDGKPLFPFGYGLSYSTFEYSDLSISQTAFLPTDQPTLNVTLTNSSEVEGVEVVQFYMRDLSADVTRPVKQLIGFERVGLKAGASKDIQFQIPMEALKYWNSAMEEVLEPGFFEFMVGRNSEDVVKLKAELKAEK